LKRKDKRKVADVVDEVAPVREGNNTDEENEEQCEDDEERDEEQEIEQHTVDHDEEEEIVERDEEDEVIIEPTSPLTDEPPVNFTSSPAHTDVETTPVKVRPKPRPVARKVVEQGKCCDKFMISLCPDDVFVDFHHPQSYTSSQRRG
jgi:hypothetical protein